MVGSACRFSAYLTAEMKTIASSLFPSLLVGAMVAGGCASRTATEAPPSNAGMSAAEDAEAYGLREHHRYHQGGVGLFFAMSLETLGTSPEQSAEIEKVRTSLRASMEPLHAAQRRLLATLADGLSHGALEPTTVNAAILGVSSTAPGVRDAVVASLDELHAVLTPPQRSALADKVESHWAVWRSENLESQGTTPATEHGHLAALATELDLSPGQQEQIRAALRSQRTEGPPFDQQKSGARLRALAEGFRQEQFDARVVDQGEPEPGMAAWAAAHLAHLVEAMSPVLSAEQRTQLAEKLREHARHSGVTESKS
jgi:hypothetical protein